MKPKLRNFDYFSYLPIIAAVFLPLILIAILVVLNLIQPNITLAPLDSENGNFSLNNQPAFVLNSHGFIKVGSIDQNGSVLGAKTGTGEVEINGIKISTEVLKNNQITNIRPEIYPLEGKSDQLTINLPKTNQFSPGKYQINVTLKKDRRIKTVGQDFTWGVLAINPDKDVYKPGEEAFIGMAVLDDEGNMVCDSDVVLTITPPHQEKTILSTKNGQIKISPECAEKKSTTLPDYYTKYQIKGNGKYSYILSATTKNGTRTQKGTILAEEKPDFYIKRESTTRIYPPLTYKMKITVNSSRDFEGTITDTVPSSFTITANKDFQVSKKDYFQKIVWQKKIIQNETLTLTYQYRIPPESPQFYLIGKLNLNSSLTTYQEKKFWQIAADSPTYQFKTGKYVGSAGGRSITGLGFSPELVIIKATTTAGVGAFFKTTAMPDNATAYLGSATANDTTGLINLESDGFSVFSTNANAANVNWTWMAFAGSDCSATGQFCVGAYTGTGSGTKAIPAVGFQPDLVMVKAATAVAPSWRSSSMPANYAQFFIATAQDTSGAYFTTLDSGGFTVGASNNTSAAFYYVAFKNVAGSINVGSYTGNGTSQSIGSMGFNTDAVFLKNANAGTAVGAVYNIDQSYGNSSSYFTDTANVVGSITSLDSNGFSVGADSTANGSGNTIYWAAFGGSAAPTSSGTFKMATGTYTGNGEYRSFNGLGFAPDLVIIKGNTTQAGVFRTSLHSNDLTSYLDAATADFALGIQVLNPDGFSIGTSATVNSNGVAYYWTAFGNAWRPGTSSGASDFMIGSYYGNGIDSRNITNMPWQPDFVAIKAATATAGTFRTSAQSGDLSSFYAATAEAANNIQALNSDGFQVGTAANVNTAATLYWYFAFKNSTNFTVNTYSGNGGTQNITSAGFQPDYLWVKATAATRGVEKHVSMAAANSAPFINVAEISTAFSGFISNGFGLTNAAETNSSGTNNYRYVAWKKTDTVATPAYKFKTGKYVGSAGGRKISGLGFAPELVILKATTNAGVGAFFKSTSVLDNASSYLASATADDANGLITLESDGFSVSGTNANTANINWSWMAFAGSDCSATGQFCIGNYQGSGSGTKSIATVGFQPDFVAVKAATAVAPSWRSSSMAANNANFFMATAQDTTGAWFTTLDATGFTVGASQNTAAAYHFFAFKNTANAIKVSTYSGNGTSQNITDAGFSPDAVIVKNANAGTAVGAVFNVDQSYGNSSSYFTDTANVVGAITGLTANGFDVGSQSAANGSGNAIYYAAFGGSAAPTSSGTFKMATGTYTGNGEYRSFNGLGFAPDLVIIKGNTTAAGVFRTTLHSGDVTSYLDAATADFALGIQALNPDGFSIGTSATVNSNGVSYYWTAYGNAWRPGVNSGASDFMIGAYYGNGIDSRNIANMPFQSDMITAKAATAVAGTYRTSAMAGDLSGFFAATAEAANNIQALNSDGFQVGTAGNVNTAATLYWYFAFKNGSNFTVNTYSGNGGTQNITSAGFQPDYLWVKATGATRGVEKYVSMAAANSAPFINVAEISTAFSGFISNGFGLTNAAETNTSGSNNYRYVAWKLPPTPTINVGTVGNQTSSMNVPSTNQYVGGAFTFTRNTGSANVTSITITETGNVNANSNLSNLDLYYETSGTCSYEGTETLFDTADSFDSSEKATATGTMTVGTSQVCVYAILDVGSGASNGQTLDIEINSSSNVLVSSGSVGGTFPVAIAGTTTLSSGNNNPNSPTDLAQKKTDDTTLSVGAWTNEASVKFAATTSDPDANQVQLCVEKDQTGIAFSNTEDLCGSLVASGGTATVTISSQTDATEYHWQARTKDDQGAYSNWVAYGGNNDPGDRDYGIDTTAPTEGTVNDGASADQNWNDGSLTELKANWSGFNTNASGLLKYEYAVQRSSDSKYWKAGTGWQVPAEWINNTTNTSTTVSSMNLQTGENYYFSVKCYDNAGNIENAVSSNGQRVLPTLSFSLSGNTVTFDNLNDSNSWTNTKTSSVQTSTNAATGYTVRAYETQPLTSVAYPSKTISNYSATWASPAGWSGGTYGFGYSSSDALVQGSNRFGNSPCPGGGTPACYAPFSGTEPGDIVADHTDAVNGQTGSVSNETFTVTYKVAVSTSQAASTYQTYVTYLITANF